MEVIRDEPICKELAATGLDGRSQAHSAAQLEAPVASCSPDPSLTRTVGARPPALPVRIMSPCVTAQKHGRGNITVISHSVCEYD